jgi:hypothetical protein
LALEGGGDKGAYQVGVIQGFVKNLQPEEVAYDFIVGVSAGALNTAFFSQFAQGNETAAAAALANIWLTAPVSSLMVQWPGSYLQGLLFENSLLDGSALYPWLSSIVKEEPLRKVSVGATNEDLGIFQDFDETIGYPTFVEATLASSAFPVFIPNRQLFNHSMMDGGCIINVDVFHGIERCLNLTGGDESQVIIDTILLSGSYIPYLNASNSKTYSVLSRAQGISSADAYLWYLYNAQLAYPGVNFRYTVLPTQTLPGGLIPLDFDQKDMIEMMNQGMQDAEDIINGNRLSTQEIVQLYMSKRNSRITYPRSQ